MIKKCKNSLAKGETLVFKQISPQNYKKPYGIYSYITKNAFILKIVSTTMLKNFSLNLYRRQNIIGIVLSFPAFILKII